MSPAQPKSLPNAVSAALLACMPPRRFLIAASGGLDSSVLMHAVAGLRGTLAPCELRVVHVEHGLHRDASTWSSRCTEQAEALGLGCTIRRIAVGAARGESLEARAREARYSELAAELSTGEVLLTAHHADDQLETVLLALLRGSGVHGLAAMAERASFARGWHVRPLLRLTRAMLASYARAEAIAFCEDPSNLDERFARNYLRRAVVPLLTSRWPAATSTALRSAALCAEAATLADELAAMDLAACERGASLDIGALAQLSDARARNVLRAWIRRADLRVPSRRTLEILMREGVRARPDAQPRVAWESGEVRRHGGRLHLLASAPRPPARRIPCMPGETIDLGALGLVTLEETAGLGLDARLLEAGELTLRFRRGGERLRPAAGGRRRTLKNLFQEHDILPWMRDCIPLLHVHERLVAVADLWMESDAVAHAGARAFRVRWERHPSVR